MSSRKFTSLLKIIAILLPILFMGAQSISTYAASNDSVIAEELPTNIPSPPDLDKNDLARKAIIVDLAKVPKVTPEVKLVSSYPNSTTVLWLPLREAHLTFDKPVRPVDVKLEILDNIQNSKQPVVVRASADPDLRTIRFSVNGVKSGNWIMKWTAGKSTGLVNFKMTVTPKALGGQNHRHDSAGIVATDKIGKYALMAIPLMIFLLQFSRKKINRTISFLFTVASASLALYAGYLALDFTSSKDFYTSLSSASPWSWLTIAILEIVLFLEIQREKIALILSILLALVIATTPHSQNLARALVISIVYFILVVNIFTSIYAIKLRDLKNKFFIKLGLVIGITLLMVVNIFSANGFVTPYGEFRDALNNSFLTATMLLVSYMLIDQNLYKFLKIELSKFKKDTSYISFKNEIKKDSSEKKFMTKFLDNSDVFIEVASKNTLIYLKNRIVYHALFALLLVTVIVVLAVYFYSLGAAIQFAPALAGL